MHVEPQQRSMNPITNCTAKFTHSHMERTHIPSTDIPWRRNARREALTRVWILPKFVGLTWYAIWMCGCVCDYVRHSYVLRLSVCTFSPKKMRTNPKYSYSCMRHVIALNTFAIYIFPFDKYISKPKICVLYLNAFNHHRTISCKVENNGKTF